ncbi:MAG TPA: hypothetical protein VFQ66_04185 [Candidatus Limnocylindria bacterium]|nr:hypothetical protein [Candidatus Limnocylindria bacterium]
MRAALALALAAVAAQSCAAVTPQATITFAPATTAAAVATVEPTPTVDLATTQPSPLPTATPFRPCPSPQKVVGGVSISPICVPGANVLVENVFEHADLQVLYDQVVQDLAAVQQEFAWTLRLQPTVEVFATTASYTTGLVHELGYSGATAAFVAENSVAFFEPDLRTILVNWAAVRDRRPIAAIRHELTHFVTLEACEPRCDLIPAWLNEGQARLAEATIPGGEWRLARVRYEAASMVATDTLIPLSNLVSQGQWNDITSWAGYYKYQQAARATELLRADIGGAQPIARLYDRLRRGENVARAYAALTGRTFESFVDGLAARFTDGVPAGPAIVTTAGPQAGHGVGYLLYGFGSEEKVTLRVVGRRLLETEEITVSPQGAHFAEIVDRYPPGTYVIVVTSGDNVIASTNFDKRGGRPIQLRD